MKIIFAGTPEFAIPPLQALIDSEHDVVLVATQPDRPAGRGRKLTPSPVKQLALQYHIPVFQPLSLKEPEAQSHLQQYSADIMIVVAYGLLLPPAVLTMPEYGCLNIHASLLPQWRGAAPIARALLAGDKKTGISIMQMDAGLDTGDVLYTSVCHIQADDNAQTLHDKLSPLGAQALLSTLQKLANQEINAIAQESTQSSYAGKLSKKQAVIDWQQPAEQIHNQIRAFNPWPVAQTQWGDKVLRLRQSSLLDEDHQTTPGTVVRSHKNGIDVATGTQLLRVLNLQLPGAKALNVADFVNAHDLTHSLLG